MNKNKESHKFLRNLKSQAAMEFLMTYGWAILVVLAAIAALAYFGVLSPEKFLPEKCVLAPGLACVQHKIEPTSATLVLSNGLGRTIIITSVDIAGKCSSTFNTTMTSGSESTFSISGCSNGASKEAFKGEITIVYTDKSYNISKTIYGDIATKIE